MALVTAHRVQTLALIQAQNISITKEGIEIKIPEQIKTSGPNRLQPVLKLPNFVEKPHLCAAKAIYCYLQRTKSLRPFNESKLFITYKKPYRAASSQSLSRWIKMVLGESGLDTSIFTAHSTRHAATSAAARNGVSLDLIRNTAGWSSASKVFATFYNKPLLSNESFARTIINS